MRDQLASKHGTKTLFFTLVLGHISLTMNWVLAGPCFFALHPYCERMDSDTKFNV